MERDLIAIVNVRYESKMSDLFSHMVICYVQAPSKPLFTVFLNKLINKIKKYRKENIGSCLSGLFCDITHS